MLTLGRGRPFETIKEHDETLIARWNATVSRGDRVYHLGDFALTSRIRAVELLGRLNGEKHLVLGNHDDAWDSAAARTHWASVHELRSLRVGNHRFVLCHYPLLTWNGAGCGKVAMLHGHCHGNLPIDGPRVDVGVDCWDYRPVSVDTLALVLDRRPPYVPVDHHSPAGIR